jgi:hypothetical protein
VFSPRALSFGTLSRVSALSRRPYYWGLSVRQYFFAIRDFEKSVRNDPRGTNLPNATEALSYAEQTISELRHEFDYDNPRLMMIVQDEARHFIWSLPFLPACA